MQIVLTLLAMILFALAGLATWASSDRPLALREIAMNSRRDPREGSDFVLLKVLSVLLKVFAVIIWNLGVLAVIFINLANGLSFLPAAL
jgi:hypothetical protein